MWDNSLGEKGQGDCMCTLVLIRDNRVEGRGKREGGGSGWEVTLLSDWGC